MSANQLEDRITELETRLEFQDHTIAELNDALVAQQQRVFELESRVRLLTEQLQNKPFDQETPQEEPPPPHY